MKKILIIIPTIIIILLGSFNLNAYAAVNFSHGLPNLAAIPIGNADSYEYYSKEYMEEDCNSNQNPYMYLAYTTYNESRQVYASYSLYFFEDDNSFTNFSVSYDEETGFYKAYYPIDNTGYSTDYLNFYLAVFRYDSPGNLRESEFFGYLVSSVEYNPETYQLIITNTRSGNTYTSELFIPEVCLQEFETNFFDMISSKLDLSVSFNPNLSGEVDRIVEQNGVQAESNYFSMNITNNSKTNAQFMMYIAPKGSEPTFTNDEIHYSGVMHSKSPIYYLTYNEWIYAPIINAKMHSFGKELERYYSKASSWHVVKSGETYTRNFNWNQIPIKAGIEYDVIVLALPTSFDKASTVFRNSENTHYINILESGQEVFRSTFSVLNPVIYDSTNTEFGNIANTGGISADKEHLYANGYVDENGEVIIEDINVGSEIDKMRQWEAGIIDKEINDLSFDNLKNILNSSTTYFNFYGTFFSWLPTWVWEIIFFGLTSLIIVSPKNQIF